jgi:hypothetical protein
MPRESPPAFWPSSSARMSFSPSIPFVDSNPFAIASTVAWLTRMFPCTA